MGLPQPKKRYTFAEYLALEREASYKSDYYDGEIFAMAEGTGEHSLITANVNGALWKRLEGKPCAVYESSLLVRVRATGLTTYPDAAVYCGEVEYDPEDEGRRTALNPTALFEVLSESTEGYDRGVKADSYRRIPSLKSYSWISQWEPQVVLFEREAGGDWKLREARGMDATIIIPGIDVKLLLAEIYAKVVFQPRTRPWRVP